MRYIRFGEIPLNGKSINFLSMSYKQNEDFTYDCETIGYIRAAEKLPESVFEAGLSVFEMNNEKMPVLKNLQLVSSLCKRIGSVIYEVEGQEIGTGNDGEPLIAVERVIKCRKISQEKLVDLVLETLLKNFKTVEFNKDEVLRDSTSLHHFSMIYKVNKKTGEKVKVGFCEPTNGNDWVVLPEIEEYTFKGWCFSNPIEGFETHLGYKKNEETQDLVCIAKSGQTKRTKRSLNGRLADKNDKVKKEKTIQPMPERQKKGLREE